MPFQRFCDFESQDNCGYLHDLTANFNWTRYQDQKNNLNAHPQYDHTTFTAAGIESERKKIALINNIFFLLGNYMYIETGTARKTGDIARLISPLFPASNEYNCLQFYYHQSGSDFDVLNIYKRDVDGSLSPLKIFTSQGNHFDEWHIMEVNIVPSKPYNLIFECVVGNSSLGDIAIDDVLVKERACSSIGNCDFEQGMCTYKNAEKNRELNWIRMRGDAADNTLGTNYGTYLAFDMISTTTTSSSRAVLISHDLDNTAQYCFEYYYRRYGNGIGNLIINRETFTNTTVYDLLVKHESKDFTEKWKINQIALDPLLNQTSNVYRLLFEAISIDGTGRLLLDDFKLTYGPCPSLPSNCSIECNTSSGTRQCIPTNKVCDFNIDCLNGDDERLCGYDCNFERGQCNYTDSSVGLYKWRRQRADLSVSSTNSSPLIDHTTLSLNGYYMIVLTNNDTIDERAHLLSPLLQQSSATCELTFYYYMTGINVDRLQVLLLVGSQSSRIYSIEGNQNNQWHKAVVKIGRLYRPFRINFDVRKIAASFAHIAIDDIQWVG
ncbi:unnamed protein product, partial [Rotaria sp. Silwood2]